MGTWSGWDVEVLVTLGAPVKPESLRLLDAWQRAEGGQAAFNPLNTTQPAFAATNYNSVGVKNYPTQQVGLRATITALQNGRYDGIVADLRAGTFTAGQILTRNASEFATWGTGASNIANVLGVAPPVPLGVIGGPVPGQPAGQHAAGAWAELQRALGHDLGRAVFTSRRVRQRLHDRIR